MGLDKETVAKGILGAIFKEKKKDHDDDYYEEQQRR